MNHNEFSLLEELNTHHSSLLRSVVFSIDDPKTLGSALRCSLFMNSLEKGDLDLLFKKFLVEKIEGNEKRKLTWFVDPKGRIQGVFRVFCGDLVIHEAIYKNNVREKSTRWKMDGTLHSERVTLGEPKLRKLSVKMWREDGTLKEEFTTEKGVKVGIYKSWRSNGLPMSESNNVNGKREGVCKYWSRSGVLTEAYYEGGKRVRTIRRVRIPGFAK